MAAHSWSVSSAVLGSNDGPGAGVKDAQDDPAQRLLRGLSGIVARNLSHTG